MVVELLAAGAHKDALSYDRSTPLIVAAREGHPPVVNTLLSSGANVTLSNKDFQTALSAAASGARHDMVKAVLRHGADVNARGMLSGGSALHAICRYPLDSDDYYIREVNITVEVLLRWGADEQAVDNEGNTPAHMIPDNPDDTIRNLLARAPVDKAWYRRGWLAMLRARCERGGGFWR